MALVVNAIDRQGIRVDQIAQALLPVAVQIPQDRQALATAANQGVPLIMRDESRPVSQGILQLAEYVLEHIREAEQGAEEGDESEAGGLRLGRLFR